MRFAATARAMIILLALSTTACVTPRPGSFKVAYEDPWEQTNRKLYKFNKRADKYVLKPLAQGYRAVVPTAARRGIGNGYNNIQEPLSFVNAVLQGKISQAFRIADRFIINTTLGVGGLADQATDMGRPEEKEEFGQTFAWWGIPSGPYVMVPFFGPRTLLDTAGVGADFFLDPVDIVRNIVINIGLIPTIGIFGAKATVTRAYLLESGADGFLGDSLDEYAAVRSAYLQRRWSKIWDGNPPEDSETFEDAPLAPGATPPEPAAPATTPPASTPPPKPSGA